jgi:hypothetical protein
LDQPIIRCPRLGGEVTFAYCVVEGGDLPCPRILVCWQPYFPAESYLKEKLTPEQWDHWCNRKPKDKMSTLLDLIEQARDGAEDKE